MIQMQITVSKLFWKTIGFDGHRISKNCLVLLSPEPYEVVLEQNGEHMLLLPQSFWAFPCQCIVVEA